MRLRDVHLTIQNLHIKAEKTEVKNNNLAHRFLQSLSGRFPSVLDIKEVYNLTINGSGRYYFTPAAGVICMYFLGEFEPTNNFTRAIPALKDLLK